MNSKKKFLSLLVFAPLLVGCGNNVSKPKFAKFSNEVKTFDKFVEELTKAREKTSIFKEAKVGSLELKGEHAHKDLHEAKRDGKVISSSSDCQTDKGTSKFDAESLVYVQKFEVSDTRENKDGYGTDVTKTVDKYNLQIQVKDSKNVASINLDKKEYSVAPLGEVKAATFFDSQAKIMFGGSLVSDMQNILGHYSEAKKDNFKFYKDGDIFTVVEKREDKKEYEVSTEVETYEHTVQVEIVEGKWSTKSYYCSTITATYKQNYYTAAKGDVVTEKEEDSSTCVVQSKKVGLKNLDLGKYSEAPSVE
jgi:hypothetical protein